MTFVLLISKIGAMLAKEKKDVEGSRVEGRGSRVEGRGGGKAQ